MASIDLQELADSMGSPLVIAAAPPAVPRVVAANGLAQALLRMSLDELRGKGVGEVFHTDRTGWQQAMQSPAGGTVEPHFIGAKQAPDIVDVSHEWGRRGEAPSLLHAGCCKGDLRQ